MYYYTGSIKKTLAAVLLISSPSLHALQTDREKHTVHGYLYTATVRQIKIGKMNVPQPKRELKGVVRDSHPIHCPGSVDGKQAKRIETET